MIQGLVQIFIFQALGELLSKFAVFGQLQGLKMESRGLFKQKLKIQ